ncbi:hypothetical protein BDB01DRAFT_836656 [Pilobolus umbonatus]|nr:hypothetical protein BDB01DRAFT_836656 [Pilobolus umbonatus]
MHPVILASIIVGGVFVTIAGVSYVNELLEVFKERQNYSDYRSEWERRRRSQHTNDFDFTSDAEDYNEDDDDNKPLRRTGDSNIRNRRRYSFEHESYEHELHELSEMEEAIRKRKLELLKKQELHSRSQTSSRQSSVYVDHMKWREPFGDRYSEDDAVDEIRPPIHSMMSATDHSSVETPTSPRAQSPILPTTNSSSAPSPIALSPFHDTPTIQSPFIQSAHIQSPFIDPPTIPDSFIEQTPTFLQSGIQSPVTLSPQSSMIDSPVGSPSHYPSHRAHSDSDESWVNDEIWNSASDEDDIWKPAQRGQ